MGILLEPRPDFHSYTDDTFGAPTTQHRILRIRQVIDGWEVKAVPPTKFDRSRRRPVRRIAGMKNQ